jgi:hypothetical protein
MNFKDLPAYPNMFFMTTIGIAQMAIIKKMQEIWER